MSYTNPIDPFKDVTVRSEEMKRADKKQPMRNFSEVVEKVDERRPQKEDEFEDNKEQKKKSGPQSTLAKKGDMAPAAPLSLFDLARDQSRGGEKKQEKKEEFAFETEEEEPQKPAKVLLAVEQPDLAAVNPQPPPGIGFEKVMEKKEMPAVQVPAKGMQEIIDQIVKQVYTIKGSEGIKETVVELEGRFKGARLIIKEFDFAKNEMNITIDNLKSASDQALLNSHRQDLVDKLGKDHQIVVHIFTVTTATEPTQLDYKPGREGFAKEQRGDERGHKQHEETQEET